MSDNLLPQIKGKTILVSEWPMSIEELRDCFDDTHSYDPCRDNHDWDNPDDTVRVCLRCDYVDDRRYLMGTPEETFLKNVYHFGLLKALHRYFESKCVKYVAEEWILHKKVRNNPHNFVFYRPSLWRFALCNTMESYLRKKVYPKSK
jgi:hypothetical protein